MIWIIVGCLLYALAFWFIYRNQMLAPAFTYMGMLALSIANDPLGQPYLPINNTILISWLCLTLMVMVTTSLQPEPIRRQKRGIWHMGIGAITGMTVGLSGITFTYHLPLLYAIMVLGTAVGCFFGYIIFTKTPEGKAVGFRSGNFFKYLAAKGFPIAFAVMMAGVVPVLLLALHNLV